MLGKKIYIMQGSKTPAEDAIRQWMGEGKTKARKKLVLCIFTTLFLKIEQWETLKETDIFLNRNPYLTVLAFIKFCCLVPGLFI
jgi:hypothetical protein